MDIVDVYTELKKKFPHVDFMIDETQKHNMGFYCLKLRGLLNMKFSPPIKTTICISKTHEITDSEFLRIERNMIESFSIQKLLVGV